VVGFMPQPLYPQGKSPWCPLDRRLGGNGNFIPVPKHHAVNVCMVGEGKVPRVPILGTRWRYEITFTLRLLDL
jgi:hypothetical protein